MGIFSKLFNSSTDIEKQLEEQYVPIFQLMGMSLSQAKSTFREMLELAKEEAQSEGTLNLPQNLGDILLKKDSAMLAKRRKEGVRDEDIRWWMNRHELDRKMMIKVDDLSKFALFKKLMHEDGLNEYDAAKEVRKWFPDYGDPEDTTHTTGDDRPLPFELKDRINITTVPMLLK